MCNFVQMYLRTRVTRKNKIYSVLKVLYYNESNGVTACQVLANVLGVVPWVIDFIVDSGWAQEIVRYIFLSDID